MSQEERIAPPLMRFTRKARFASDGTLMYPEEPTGFLLTQFLGVDCDSREDGRWIRRRNLPTIMVKETAEEVMEQYERLASGQKEGGEND